MKGTKDLPIQIQRKDGVDDLEGILFEDHIVGEFLGFRGIEFLALYAKVPVGGGELEDLVALLGDFGGREGHEGAHAGSGGDEGDELGVHEFDGVGLPGEEGVDNLLGDGEGLLGGGVLAAVVDLADGVFGTALEVAGALLADEDHVDVDALRLELGGALLGLLDHEGVVAAAEPTVARDDAEGDLVDLALGEERQVGGVSAQAVDEPPEDGLEGLREGAGGEHGVLGATHLGGGDELHGGRDLLCVVYRGDAVANGCVGREGGCYFIS